MGTLNGQVTRLLRTPTVAALVEGSGAPSGRVAQVAAVLAAIAWSVLAGIKAGTGGWSAPVLGAVAGLPLVLALTAPFLGWIASAGAGIVVATAFPLVGAAPAWPWYVLYAVALVVLMFATCVWDGVVRGLAAWAGTVLILTLTVPDDVTGGASGLVSAVAAFGLLLGVLARSNARLARQTAHSVVLEERARIARDLHDVVAHHMSLVVVRAETAPYRLGELSEAARAELVSIGDTARTALAETRTLLAVLRSDDDTPEHTPQPGLDQLDTLVAASRLAGVQVAADVDGPLDDLRPGTSLAAYRIAQEALSNAARHAPGTAVRLQVRRVGDTVRVEVENPSTTTPGPAGHGITGMRERARAEGGELTAAHTADNRFVVEAVLPTGVPA